MYRVVIDRGKLGAFGPKFSREVERTFEYWDDVQAFLEPYIAATDRFERHAHTSRRARRQPYYRWLIEDMVGDGEPRYRPRPRVEPSGGRPGAPGPMPIRDPHDAEIAAAAWMRHWGFVDARELPLGPDGGIDVDSTDAVAQVKAHMRPIGRPDVQNLYGIARAESKAPLFFALSGYTPDAVAWADRVGVSLFTFDLEGSPQPANDHANEVVIC